MADVLISTNFSNFRCVAGEIHFPLDGGLYVGDIDSELYAFCNSSRHLERRIPGQRGR